MKSYVLLGGAVLFGLSAMASPKAVSNAAQFISVAEEMSTAEAVMTSAPSKAPMKAVTSTADLEGIWKCQWKQWRLNGDDPYAGKCSPYILPGDAANEIYISSLPNGQFDPILAIVDFSKATITIKSGQQIYNHPELGPLVVKTAMPVENPEDGKFYWTDMNECTGNILEDGTLDFSNCSLMGEWTNKGSYNFGFGNFAMTKANYFEFVASEWEEQSDKASYTDGWVAPLLQGYPSSYPQPQDVTYYVNKANRNLFAFANPYAGSYWDPINECPEGKTKEGFVVIDATVPECVLIRTLVASGLWMVMGNEGDPADMFYLYNNEGYKADVQGITAEDQAGEYLAVGADPSKFLSSYKDGLFNLMNLEFGFGTRPNDALMWTAAEKNKPVAKITVKQSGVDGIEIEGAEGAVKYFNMQGIEVINPAKGQLVIKKQGNKVEKVVM